MIRKQGNELYKHKERLLVRKGLSKSPEVECTCKEEPGEMQVCNRDRIRKGKLMNMGVRRNKLSPRVLTPHGPPLLLGLFILSGH